MRDGGYYRGEYLALFDHYEHGVKFPNANGKRHGRGVRVWANGNKYEGEWRDDLMYGTGVFTYSTGGRYVGEFVDGLQGFQGVRNALELSLNFAPIAAGFEAFFHGAQSRSSLGGVADK